MLDKLINFVQQSAVAKFCIVGLIVAISQSIVGHASIVLWIAVILSLIPVLSTIAFLDDKLSYDQKFQIKINGLAFSSLAWAIFMMKDLQAAPQAYAFTFTVLTASALVLFNALKQRLAVLIPLLIAFVFLLVFVLTPAAYALAFLTVLFTALLLTFDLLSPIAPVEKKALGAIGSEDKMELISELDFQKTENQQLREKVKQIEIDLSSAEMAKMEFLATMSHEIRTPLNGIIPLLDILLDSELSDFQRDYLSTAHVSAIQMQKLIDDLLDYSKVEAGKLTVETRGLKVLRIMAAVNSSFQQAAEKKNLKIEVDVHRNVSPLLRGDPTRLRQVLSNLLSNAIKFSNTGTIKIAAKKLKDFPNKEIIRFEVIDQGIGLDKETSENIFQAFTQEDGSSTRKFGGTGLGLAISKKIVELMHGTIHVDSAKGRGSNFYFDLPFQNR